ncbi:MAG: 5'-methylthioadenosine/adenosylhomocysteine nucleosidase [Muribaculaceae bacterium]|nr:5'-methylthioadenosine/adenosylhomocysteine nucleosidase [Muribaculaceae bacterium]
MEKKKNKTIVLIVAMSKELRLLLPLIKDLETHSIEGVTFYEGCVGNNRVIASQCGIGKVNAAIGAYSAIKCFSPDLVINTGVAGGASVDINVMDVVVADKIAYHDVWCGPGTEWGMAAGCPLYFECNDYYNTIAHNLEVDNVVPGLICSGDQFIASIETIEQIKTNFPNVVAVDMESAAIAQVCYKQGVPFICLRVISDSPGASHNNSVQYENFWEEAPEHVFDIVSKLLNQI